MRGGYVGIRNDATIHFIGNGGSVATPSYSAEITEELQEDPLSCRHVALAHGFANDVL